MLITELTKTAVRIAEKGHSGQVDRGGTPYIQHPLFVAEQMNTESRTLTAILHDVLEDTAVTREELLLAGIPESVVKTVELLTRKKAEPYREYIRRIAESENRDAIAVKYADVCHNLDTSRIKNGKLPQRLLDRYTAAKAVLEPLLK